LAPTPQAMRKLLQKCDEYAEDFSVIFNARKSKCIYYPGKVDTSAVSKTGTSTLPSFFIGGNSIDYVDKWPHLGHILNAALSDDDDVEHRRVQTVKQINDVLCYFGKLDSVIKLKLLYSYCSSMCMGRSCGT
jgi:hypothetical protein